MQYHQEQQLFLNSTGHVARYFGHMMTDLFYLPERLASKFLVLASYFRQKKVFVEVAVPQILVLINNGSDNMEAIGVRHSSFCPSCWVQRQGERAPENGREKGG
jgi:hypothetical protein